MAYAIVSVPLTNFFYGLCFPNTPIHNGGVPARLGYLVFSYLIATLIPVCRAPLTHTHTHTHMHWDLACSLLEDQPSHGDYLCIHNIRRPV